MNQINFLQPTIQILKKQIGNILDSYHNEWDILAELSQNSVDAIRSSISSGNIDKGKIDIIFDTLNKQISITDNGCGISIDDLPIVVKPNSSKKEKDDSTIGEKGVGMKYVIFSSNYFYIKSGDGNGTSEGKISDAFIWSKNDVSDDLLLFNHKILDEFLRGTKIEIKNLPNSDDLFNLNYDQLEFLLRTKTALGNTRKIWDLDKNIDIDINITYISKENKSFSKKINFEYMRIDNFYESLDFDKYLEWKLKAEREPKDKRNKLKNKIIFRKGFELTRSGDKINYLAYRLPSRNIYDEISKSRNLINKEFISSDGEINKDWKEINGYLMFSNGTFISTKGMPTGLNIEIKNPGYSGYWFNYFILLEYDKFNFDIGRKSITGSQKRMLEDISKKIFNEINNEVHEYIKGVDDHQLEFQFDRTKTFHEINTLDNVSFRNIIWSKDPSGQEANISALFYMLIQNGSINLIPMMSGYKNRYDLYAFKNINNVKYEFVVEFKPSILNIISDLKSEIKYLDEVDVICCYNITEKDIEILDNKGITIKTKEHDNVIPETTHIIQSFGHKPTRIIDIRQLLQN